MPKNTLAGVVSQEIRVLFRRISSHAVYDPYHDGQIIDAVIILMVPISVIRLYK